MAVKSLKANQMEDQLPQEPSEATPTVTTCIPPRGKGRGRGRGRGSTARGKVQKEETALAKPRAAPTILTEEQKEDMVAWIQDHECFYNKGK